MRRCDIVIWTGLGGAVLGALAGIVAATDTLQVLLYAVGGVWAGSLAGALLGAIACAMRFQRREDRARAGSDLRAQAPDELVPAGL